ncbi:esterase-like activity of phytase family protein [Lutibaculum baratangense]|uniref:Alkaline phosphatase n=1 Tax=Lutibaculum baratangense AMV1 TaxID=631454 RepID=V4RB21_9HYPH|nr:esterase-like activity of phytase family protein [Lutibaculum baratangense]ESR22599.1 Alkaline phosphatase [Lutibaculum baratangense AMV1]
MRLTITSSVLAIAAVWGLPAAAQSSDMFNRIATFPVAENLPADRDQATETVAEIISATEDGMTLVYTDSPQSAVGIIDISDARAPAAAGFVPLDGEPTSVVVAGGKAFVGVKTSESYTEPSGQVATVDIAGTSVEATCDIPGQPDSVALSKDGGRLAVVLENERDEDLNDGQIPQLPSGSLVIFSVADGAVDCASMQEVDLTGLAEIAPEDAEPEFVDVNEAGEAVVTLQENNHIAIVDLESGEVTAHFSAGTVDLDGIDATRDMVIDPTESATGLKREPDTVKWLDDERFVTANEGDYQGGSRGFTIFAKSGEVLWDAGNAFERLGMRIGHYPEKRSGAKGTEPEGLEVASFGDDRLIFVGSERGSFVAVYRDTGDAPEFLQVLPSGVGPEGLLAIPSRNLFVTANERDFVEDGGVRATVMIYERGGEASYPTIESVDSDGAPITWGALSGLAADPEDASRLYAVSDSFYAQSKIFTIDASQTPAKIVDAKVVTQDGAPMEKLDLEGIAVAPEGGFWLASEGNPEKEMDDRLIRVDTDGAVQEILTLPEEIRSQAIRYGFEGVTVAGSGDDRTIWAAVQREWKDDPAGMVKLVAYKPATEKWGVVHYPLDEAPKGWIGLSEITATEDGRLLIVERDNQIGQDAAVKRLYAVSLDGIEPALPGEEAPIVEKTLVRDLLEDLRSANGYVLDKIEGFTLAADGSAYIVTDNDGVDDSNGETQFMKLGDFSF